MEITASTRALLIGHGRLGARFAALLKATGAEVWATARSKETVRRLRETGVSPIWFDFDDIPAKNPFPPVDIVIITAAAKGGEAAYRNVYGRGVPTLLKWLSRRRPAPFVLYTSSTAVHDVRDGSWIDEASPLNATSAEARHLVTAERAVAAYPGDSVVFRLSGIYGPGRDRALKAVAAGLPVAAPEHYTNLIHEDDAVAAAWHLLRRAKGKTVVIGSDGHPVRRGELYRWLAARIGCPAPPQSNAAPERRAAQNKRCSNTRLMESGYTLLHADYRSGYAAGADAILRGT